MTLKDLLETVLLSQKVTLVRLIDCGNCEDQVLLNEVEHSKIPYSTVVEFLDRPILTVEAQLDSCNQPILYIEI